MFPEMASKALIAVSRAQLQLDVLAQIFPNCTVIAMKYTYFKYGSPVYDCGKA